MAKDPVTAFGGTVKRLATKASQRCSEGRVSEQILTPIAFFDFCSANIKNINFVFSTYAEYEQEQVLLQERHSNANTIAGTQKLHYFRPVSFNEVLVKRFSNSGQSSVKKVSNVWRDQ